MATSFSVSPFSASTSFCLYYFQDHEWGIEGRKVREEDKKLFSN